MMAQDIISILALYSASYNGSRKNKLSWKIPHLKNRNISIYM